METGGCDSKTGRAISAKFTFARYSQTHGVSSQLPVSGKEIQQVDHTLHLMLLKKRKKN